MVSILATSTYFSYLCKEQNNNTPMTHGHEVLHMMEGNSYKTKQELINAIVARFGADERFYTCSAEDLTAAELVDFLEERGKFMPATGHDDFTVDTSKICSH